MTRITKYTQDTIGLPLIPSIKNSGNIELYINAAFPAQKVIRRHTGGLMTMVIGGAYVQYSFKKLSTNNSTESKLVGVDNVLTQMIWTQYFLKDQGYDIRDNVIYQDNQSNIKLKKNGRISSRKW